MPLADAERMPRGVRIDLMAIADVQVRRSLENACAEADGLVVCPPRILDVEIEVHLLRGAVGPHARSPGPHQWERTRSEICTRSLRGDALTPGGTGGGHRLGTD